MNIKEAELRARKREASIRWKQRQCFIQRGVRDMLKHYDMKDLNFEQRLAMMSEELDELRAAETPEDRVDALIDLLVFTVGTIELAGVDLQKAFNTVMEANMAKVPGTVTRDGITGQDLIKPDGWVAPDHTGNTGGL